jgi:tetratricopeptide (TPR) repeat protein
MKTMKIKFYLPLLLAITACSSEKFGTLTQKEIESEPKVLELVGNSVDMTLAGTFPDHYFPKHGVLTITPVLRTAQGDIEGESLTFYGEDVKNPGLLVVPYSSGGTFTETQTIEYSPEMKNSELYAIFKAEVDGKSVPIKQIKLADGIITTSTLVDKNEALPITTHETLSGKTSSTEMGTIRYEIDRSKIRASQLEQKDMIALVNTLKDLQKSTRNPQVSIEIFSTASPDGSPAINKKVSQQRNAAATTYMKTELKKYGLNIPIQTTILDADWEGLYNSIMQSNLSDKTTIVENLKKSKSGNRYKVLKKYINAHPGLFKENLLPPLRKSTITINTQTPEKTDEWLMSMMKNSAEKLSLNDWLRGTNLLKSNAEKEKSYLSIIKKYPKDWRAYNNLGAMYIREGKWDEAQNYLEQSHSHRVTPENDFNLGLVALHAGNLDEAENYFSNLPVSKEWREAQGTIAIIMGDYAAAENFFGDIKSNNAGLSQILNKDYPKATITLDEIVSPNDTTYYLKAVLGARTNNSNMVYNNLYKVQVLDHAFSENARNDIEFHKYWNSCQFNGVLK